MPGGKVALLSGGLDSTVALAHCLATGFDVREALSFNYGQTHAKELMRANSIARYYNLPWSSHTISFNHIRPGEVGQLLRYQLDPKAAQQTVKDWQGNDVSATFVPGRNIIFLAFAASLADSKGYDGIIIGVNAVDYSGYPDCRPEFIVAQEQAFRWGLRAPVMVHAPIIRHSKADIIRLGMSLKAPLALTWSCYTGGEKPCGVCPSCEVRAKGFSEVGCSDPALQSPSA